MSYVECYEWRGVAVDENSGEPNIQIDVSENLIDVLIRKISEDIAWESKSESLAAMKKLSIDSKNLRSLLTAKDAFRNFRIEELSKPEVDDEG